LESTWSVNILFVIAQRGRVRHSQGWSQHMLPAPSMPTVHCARTPAESTW
jgi:hypothetical protein